MHGRGYTALPLTDKSKLDVDWNRSAVRDLQIIKILSAPDYALCSSIIVKEKEDSMQEHCPYSSSVKISLDFVRFFALQYSWYSYCNIRIEMSIGSHAQRCTITIFVYKNDETKNSTLPFYANWNQNNFRTCGNSIYRYKKRSMLKNLTSMSGQRFITSANADLCKCTQSYGNSGYLRFFLSHRGVLSDSSCLTLHGKKRKETKSEVRRNGNEVPGKTTCAMILSRAMSTEHMITAVRFLVKKW